MNTNLGMNLEDESFTNLVEMFPIAIFIPEYVDFCIELEELEK